MFHGSSYDAPLERAEHGVESGSRAARATYRQRRGVGGVGLLGGDGADLDEEGP